MSDELRASIRASTHLASQVRAESSRSTGGKVCGYDTKGQLIEAEAVIVREIFARTADSESMRTIANDLDARGVPSPGGTQRDFEERAVNRPARVEQIAMGQGSRLRPPCSSRRTGNRMDTDRMPDPDRRTNLVQRTSADEGECDRPEGGQRGATLCLIGAAELRAMRTPDGYARNERLPLRPLHIQPGRRSSVLDLSLFVVIQASHARNFPDREAAGNRRVQVSPGSPGTLCRAICVAPLRPVARRRAFGRTEINPGTTQACA
jgi:hypothetical protein